MTAKPSKSLSETIASLEKNLQCSLNPVRPSTDFVLGLKQRIVDGAAVGLEKNTPILIYLIVALGIFAGALLVWLLRRVH